MNWIKITDREPEKGELFEGAGYTSDKGYRYMLCYRDVDGGYHDILMEYIASDMARQWGAIEEPSWIKDFKNKDFLDVEPDWWRPIKEPISEVNNYQGSPSNKYLSKKMDEYKDYVLLRQIEREMNMGEI